MIGVVHHYNHLRLYDNFYRKREGRGWKMMINIITIYSDDRFVTIKMMIEIIISENDDNDGRPHR